MVAGPVSKAARWAVVVACSLLVWLALRLMPWHWFHQRLMRHQGIARPCPQPTLDRLRQWAAAINRLAPRLPWLRNCLVQALSLWTLAGKDRSCLQIFFGSRFQDGAFAAHAWVEAGDETLVGEHSGEFVPFA